MSCVHPSLTSQKMGGDGYRPSFVALITALVRKRWERQRRESKIGGNRGSMPIVETNAGDCQRQGCLKIKLTTVVGRVSGKQTEREMCT